MRETTLLFTAQKIIFHLARRVLAHISHRPEAQAKEDAESPRMKDILSLAVHACDLNRRFFRIRHPRFQSPDAKFVFRVNAG